MLRSAGLPARRVPQTVTARARESPRAGHQWGPCPTNSDLNRSDVATSGTRLALRRLCRSTGPPVHRPAGPPVCRAAGPATGRRSGHGPQVRPRATRPPCPTNGDPTGARVATSGTPIRPVSRKWRLSTARKYPQVGHAPRYPGLNRPEVPTSGTRPRGARAQPPRTCPMAATDSASTTRSPAANMAHPALPTLQCGAHRRRAPAAPARAARRGSWCARRSWSR